jgi:hypothetical protein
MLRCGADDGPDVGERVEPAVDAQCLPGAVALLLRGESGRDPWVHRQAYLAVVEADEDDLIEIVTLVRLVIVQPGDSLVTVSGAP